MSNVPEHVPSTLVRDYEPWFDSEYSKDAWGVYQRAQQELPDIYWSTALGGTWIVTRAEPMREIMQDPKLFSSRNASEANFLRRCIPIDSDPPEHTKYRIIVNPSFSPKSIDALEPWIRDIAVRLVEEVKENGECDFIESIAKVMPSIVFTRLMGLPVGDYRKFLEWVDMVLHNKYGDEQRDVGAKQIVAFLEDLLAQRKAEPKDDIISNILSARFEGEPLTDDEVLDFCFLLFIGGLDTLTSVMGHTFRFLAENPSHLEELVEHPDRMKNGIEEIIRLHPIIRTSRTCTQDIEFHNVQFKAGDQVVLYTPFSAFDEREYDDPLKADFSRCPRHISFSSGPHRCLGSHLARSELRILLEEWIKRIPKFHIKQGTEIKYHVGVLGMDQLHLEWDKDS